MSPGPVPEPNRSTAGPSPAGGGRRRGARRSPRPAEVPVVDSPLRAALDRVGDRWTLLVVDALADGALRFGELAEQVGAAPNILTDRLRRLGVEGLLVAEPYSERPVRFHYRLSASGAELAAALVTLAAWGAIADGRSVAPFHQACGSAIELRSWCPTCDRPVDPHESPGTYHL